MMSGIVSVDLVAKSTVLTYICRRELVASCIDVGWVGVCTFASTLHTLACHMCVHSMRDTVGLLVLLECFLVEQSCPTVWLGKPRAQMVRWLTPGRRASRSICNALCVFSRRMRIVRRIQY